MYVRFDYKKKKDWYFHSYARTYTFMWVLQFVGIHLCFVGDTAFETCREWLSKPGPEPHEKGGFLILPVYFVTEVKRN